MLRSMLTASTTLNQLQQQIDTISSNLSNSNTTAIRQKIRIFLSLSDSNSIRLMKKMRKWQKPEKRRPACALASER